MHCYACTHIYAKPKAYFHKSVFIKVQFGIKKAIAVVLK